MACGAEPTLTLRNITDPAYKLGDDWIRAAAEICRRAGFETVVDENPGTFPAGFPMSQIALYLGWYDANASGPFAQPTVEFMPGAFAYHLHSYSAGTLRSTSQYWVGPLLAKGATITMGCVAEPYLSGTPDVADFHRTLCLLWVHFWRSRLRGAAGPVLANDGRGRSALPPLREAARPTPPATRRPGQQVVGVVVLAHRGHEPGSRQAIGGTDHAPGTA